MFDSSFTNKIAGPKGTSLNIREVPYTSAKILLSVPSGSPAGRTSGQVLKMSDGDWYQISLYERDYSKAGGKTYGYVRADVTRLTNVPEGSNSTAEANAKSLLENLISSDENIFNTCLECKKLIQTAKSNGKSVSDLEKKLDEVFARYIVRQDKLKSSQLIKYQTGYKKEVSNLAVEFQQWIPTAIMHGIGAVQIAPIVVGAIIGVALAVTVYYAFKPDYDQSKIDLNIASDLKKKIKAALTPEEYQRFEDGLKKQVADAHNDGQFAGMFSALKPIAFLIGGYYLLTHFVDSQSRRKAHA